MKYFLDTSAIVEMVKGNPRYGQYLGARVITCLLNLYELYFVLLREFSAPVAKEYFTRFRDFSVPIEDIHIFLAAELKRKHKGISYADALGYAMALSLGAKFLTGDGAFRTLEQVEFVKQVSSGK